MLRWEGITAHINGLLVCLCAAGVVSVVVRGDDGVVVVVVVVVCVVIVYVLVFVIQI